MNIINQSIINLFSVLLKDSLNYIKVCSRYANAVFHAVQQIKTFNWYTRPRKCSTDAFKGYWSTMSHDAPIACTQGSRSVVKDMLKELVGLF